MTSKPGRILVVDDAPVNVKILTSLLQRQGFATLTATDGDEAIATTRRERPDLVLLDVMMPGKSGFDVCEELRADAETADTPIIFLSALGEVAHKVKGLTMGGADYITKPFEAAEVLARVKTQIALRHLNRQLLEANRELLRRQSALDEDIRAAADIQRALIPRGPVALRNVEIAWLFEPCSRVGGDILNVMALDERHLAFYVLDVSGHGVPPAMVALLVWQSLSPAAGLVFAHDDGPVGGHVRSPSQVLEALDREYPLARFDRYFTIAYFVLDVVTGHLTYSGAGHPPPVHVRADGEIRLLDRGGPVIGLGDGGFEAGEATLGPGDRVVAYSDGITDFESDEHVRFGGGRLFEALQRRPGAQGACEAVRDALSSFATTPLRDDLTLLAVEYRPGDGSCPR